MPDGVIVLDVADEVSEVAVPARVVGERVVVDEDVLHAAVGWTLKPEGLCRGDVCVPVRDRSGIERDGGIDLEGVASALGRPAVVDPAAGVVAIGVAAPRRGESLRSLVAPDFELPDLDGKPFRRSTLAGRKQLLLAWASW
jgi:hypothetical protein